MAKHVAWYQKHFGWWRLRINRKYKDRLFRFLFRNKKDLLYFARQYEGLVAQRKDNIYGSKLVRLPTPEYVIFYNGKRSQEDRIELLLSERLGEVQELAPINEKLSCF